MNPEHLSVAEACISCLQLTAATDEQREIQEQCAAALDLIAGFEMLLDTEAEDFPEAEA